MVVLITVPNGLLRNNEIIEQNPSDFGNVTE